MHSHLGKLASTWSTLASNMVESEIERNLRVLSRRESKASSRHVAVMVLVELLASAPALAGSYALETIDQIYPLLREKHIPSRELATQLLKQCLVILRGKPSHMEGKMPEIFQNLRLVNLLELFILFNFVMFLDSRCKNIRGNSWCPTCDR
jgi:hypothetical protein